MPPVFRLVLSILAGVLSSSLILAMVNRLRKVIYPVVDGAASVMESLTAVPRNTWWLMFGGYACCALFGAWLTAWLAPSENRLLAGMFTAFLLLLGAVFYFVLVTYPAWFSICACLTLFCFGALGAWMGSRKSSKPVVV